MSQFQDAFISYGRADSLAFVQRLNQRLLEAGLAVWFDFEDIPLGVDYQQQIDAGIAHCHNFLFVLSPHAVHSPYCAKEIALALRYHKRIVPLLHVEAISRETWQKRHPDGTDADWQAYQAEGKHSIFPHLHPEIARINWIDCREGIDDFEQVIAGLRAIFERQQPYVRQHTDLLVQALAWEQHYRQPSYLLTGEARQQAEAWLQQIFTAEPPPCQPTDLHCEFITESIKQAANGMTQVFLSRAETEAAVGDELRRQLQRQGLSVWTSQRDIRTGEDFQQAIERGIEQADNLVYLISPDVLRSRYCQHELDYALSLHKRVIPILVRPVEPAAVPAAIRQLQYIDWRKTVADELAVIRELLQILRQEADYYANHKRLLTQALKWQRQDHNPSVLLRGYTLRYAEAWLQTAQKRQQQPPLAVQMEFIQASLQQPPELALDVFISYSRAESDLARQLNEALQSQGKRTWFDQESIATGADFQQEIYQGIAAADNFLFLISPRAVASPHCAGEVEYAAKLNKRFVTVLAAPVDSAALPLALARVQWIDLSGGYTTTAFSQLVRTLETDREHVRSHTRWSQRALEWQSQGHSEDLLLRGSELVVAQSWLHAAEAKAQRPLPTPLQRSLITASQALCDRAIAAEEARRQHELAQAQALAEASEARRQAEAEARLAAEHRAEQAAKARQASQRATVITAVAAPLLTVLVLTAVIAWRASQIEAIKSLSLSAEANLQSERPFEALIDSTLAGLKLKRFWLFTPQNLQGEIDGSLRQSLQEVNEINRIESIDDLPEDFAISPDGEYFAVATQSGQVLLWQLSQQRFLRQFQAADGPLYQVQFAADGQSLVTASHTGTLQRWTLEGSAIAGPIHQPASMIALEPGPQGSLITFAADGRIYQHDRQGRTVSPLPPQLPFYDADVSSDGQALAAAAEGNQVLLWGQQQIPKRLAHGNFVLAVSFSPDGQRLATVDWDNTIRIWDLQGQEQQRLSVDSPVRDLDVSPNGKTLGIAFVDGRVALLDLQTQVLRILGEHQEEATQVQFSPNGQMLISRSQDETIRLWQLRTDRPPLIRISQDAHVLDIGIEADHGYLVASHGDGSVRIDSLDGKTLTTLTGYTGDLFSASFSPDNQFLLTGSTDGSAYLWTRQGQLVQRFPGRDQYAISVAFSPDGQQVAIAAADGQTTLWDLQGKALQTFAGSSDLSWVNHVSISPDGRTLVTASDDGTAKLWDRSGTLLHTLSGHQEGVIKAVFHPDGTLVATASRDRTIRLWQTSTGRQIRQLQGHFSSITDLAFIEQGKHLVSASSDGTARLWDLKGQEVARYEQYDHEITKVKLSRDGRLLATIADDYTARLWPVESFDRLLVHSCSWLQPYLASSPAVDRQERVLCNKINAVGKN